MKPTKQTVYLPIKVERHKNHHIFDLNECDGSFIQNVVEENGYFFTPQELNEYIQKVIKQTLEAAANNAQIMTVEILADDPKENNAYVEFQKVNKQSITNTFEETFKKFEV